MSCLVFRSRRLRLRSAFRQGGALSTPLPQNRGNGGASPGDSGDEWDWCYVHRGTRGANLKPVSHQPSPHLLSPGRRCSANEQGRPERRISDISESEHVMTCFFVVGRSGALSNKHYANYPANHPRGAAVSMQPSNQCSRVTQGGRKWPACELVCHRVNHPQATGLGWLYTEQGLRAIAMQPTVVHGLLMN